MPATDVELQLTDTFGTWKDKFNQAIGDINTAIDNMPDADTLAPTNHASAATTYGVGNANSYGHLKLSDATNSTSGVADGVAVTPSALKVAYDKAVAAQSTADNAQSAASAAQSTADNAQSAASAAQSTADNALSKAEEAYDKAVAAEDAAANAGVVGEYKAAHLSSIPGYILCNGAAVSRTTYSALFEVIGTTFGAGDGRNTFNLPDFRNRVFWGADNNLGAKLEAGLPNITGNFWAYTVGWYNASGDGAFYGNGSASGVAGNRGGEGGGACRWGYNATRSSSIYGNSTTVQPPAIAVNIFIKY